MPDGRGARFALEAAFLVAVAAVLAFTDLRPVWIVLVMLVAWAVVALLEWAAWRDRPHWASGSPPRYYVPQEPLPPRPPSTELPAFTAYPRPEPRDTESPTWIATPEMREELLGWPAPPEPVAEQPTTVEELPEDLLAEVAGAGWADDERSDGDGWGAFELPLEPEDEVAEVEPEPAPELESAPPAELEAAPAPEPEPEPEPEPASDEKSQTEPERVPAPVEAVEPEAPEPPAEPAPRVARHRIDPFAETGGRRWPWTRRAEESVAVAELPPLPRHVRIAPREDER